MDPHLLDATNRRVDQALAANRRAESIVILMALAIFLLGIATAVLAYWQQNPYFTTAALVLEGLLYWPIREILKVRRDNLILQTLPAMVLTLPPDEAAEAIRKALFERLWR